MRLVLEPWSIEKLLTPFGKDGCGISYQAKAVVGSSGFKTLRDLKQLFFFGAIVGDFVPGEHARTEALYRAVHECGCCDAPDESALVIRPMYKKQPLGEWSYVLSRPITLPCGLEDVLALVRFPKSSLVCRGYAYPGYVWPADRALLVCSERPVLSA